MGGSETDPGKDLNRQANKTTLVQVCEISLSNIMIYKIAICLYLCLFLWQKKVLDYLLMLGVENQWAPVAVRCEVR